MTDILGLSDAWRISVTHSAQSKFSNYLSKTQAWSKIPETARCPIKKIEPIRGDQKLTGDETQYLAKLDCFLAQKKIQCVCFQPSPNQFKGWSIRVFHLLSAYDLHGLFHLIKNINLKFLGQQYSEYVEVDPMYAMHPPISYFHPSAAAAAAASQGAPPPLSPARLYSSSHAPLILPPPPSDPPMNKSHSILIQRIPQRLRKARGSKPKPKLASSWTYESRRRKFTMFLKASSSLC